MKNIGGMARDRIDGLDVLRSFAILFVLFGHMSEHSIPPAWMKTCFGHWGSLGVELFFVLSGYLIGGIIIRAIRAGEFRTSRDLFHFWLRRWLRTLPLYYVFLGLYLFFNRRGPFSPLHSPQYFVFMQNFIAPTPPFFELSWSLTIEEWFYLLFPIGFLALARVSTSSRRALLLAVLAFLLVPLGLKLDYALPIHGPDLFTAIRVPVLYRLDSLMYGVAIAALQQFRPGAWPLAIRLFPVGLTLFGLVLFCFVSELPAIDASKTRLALLFPVISAVCALMLPGMSSLSLARVPPLRRFFGFTSKISYSLYLGHILVIILVNHALFSHPGWRAEIYDRWFLIYPIYLLLFYGFAYVTYRLIERPGLAWRDRWTITRAGGQQAMTPPAGSPQPS